MNRIDEAESCYSNSNTSQALFSQAALENKKGNFEKSIELYNLALQEDKKPKENDGSEYASKIIKNKLFPGYLP